MGDTANCPDETLTTTAKMQGLLLVGLAVISFVVCLTSFAMRQTGVGVSAASISLLAVGAALSWLTTEARRVRDVQRRSDRAHHVVAH
jgi:uncharacterized membrane protein YcjF (UPF0283 family)